MFAVNLETLRQVQQVEGNGHAQQDKRCDDNESSNHEKLLGLCILVVSFDRAALPETLPELAGPGCTITDSLGTEQFATL